jgi:phospholipid/cholesterol/gamma-HCH transport system ATP-binding protein
MGAPAPSKIEIRDLTMAFGSFVVMRDIKVQGPAGRDLRHHGRQRLRQEHPAPAHDRAQGAAQGEILLRGRVVLGGRRSAAAQVAAVVRRALPERRALEFDDACGEHRLPLGEYTDLSGRGHPDIARLKLALVGLKGFEDYYPAEISGGMCKRAGLARALALDPDILFFDEPSAGLDPISSRNLDELILQLRDSLGATFVVVTHELESIFAIADNSVFLDTNTRTMRAEGNPARAVEAFHRSAVAGVPHAR